jgi:hypothetical protein
LFSKCESIVEAHFTLFFKVKNALLENASL